MMTWAERLHAARQRGTFLYDGSEAGHLGHGNADGRAWSDMDNDPWGEQIHRLNPRATFRSIMGTPWETFRDGDFAYYLKTNDFDRVARRLEDIHHRASLFAAAYGPPPSEAEPVHPTSTLLNWWQRSVGRLTRRD
jgi:hypothetical protein